MRWLATVVAEEEVVTVVVEVVEVDVEALRAPTLPLWVVVDAGDCLAHLRPLLQPHCC